MRHQLLVDIDDREIVGAVVAEPALLEQIIAQLKRNEKIGTPAHAIYAEIARLLDQSCEVVDRPTPAWLAEQVAALDTIGKRAFAIEATRLILPEHLTVEAP